MNESVTSWGDVLHRRNGRRCVGRQREIEQFRLNYLYEVPQSLLFVLRGQSGIGKSVLLSHFCEIAKEHGMIAAATTRWDVAIERDAWKMPIVAAMKTLADQLGAAKTPLTTFQELYRDYHRTLRAVSTDPDAPGRPLDLFGGMLDQDPWTFEAWDTYLTHTFSTRLRDLLLEPLPILTERFVQDLNAWATVRRIVLGFDDWGVTSDRLGSWLRDLLQQGELSVNIWVILASDKPLDSTWDALAPVTKSQTLNPLSPQESGMVLKNHGLESVEQIVRITDLADGIPLWLEILGSSPQHEYPNPSTTPLDAYLATLSPECRSALLQSSAARWINEDVAIALLGEAEGREFFAWLSSSPWVIKVEHQEVGDAWRFRPVLWEGLMTVAQREVGALWEAAHETLRHYYERQLERQPKGPLFSDLAWRHDRLEMLYHDLVVGEEQAATDRAMKSFLEGLRRWTPWAETVTKTWHQATQFVWSRHHVVAWSRRVSTAWSALLAENWAAALELFDEFVAQDEWSRDVKQALKTSRQLIASRLALPPEPEEEIAPPELDVETPEVASADVASRDIAAEDNASEDVASADTRLGEAVAASDLDTVSNDESVDGNDVSVFAEEEAPQPQSVPPTARPDETQVVPKMERAPLAAPLPLTAPKAAAPDSDEDDEDLSSGDEVTEPSPADGSVLADAAACAPDTPVDLCSRGNALLQEGDYEAAIQAYDETLTLDPKYQVAYYNRGLAHAHIGALGYALDDFTRAIELDLAYVPAYRQRGLAYVRQGDLERAIEDFSAALAQQPDAAVHYHDRGNAYYRLGSYEAAMEDYDAAIARQPGYVEAYINRGLAHAALGELPQALKDYGEALALDPQRAVAYNYRGQAYARLERYDQALADYDRALSLNPQYAAVHNNRGLAYLKVDAYAEAIEAYRKAMALEPDWATPYYNAACAAALVGDVERACVWLGRAIALRERYRAMALRDSDLAPLRGAPCFQALTETTPSHESAAN